MAYKLRRFACLDCGVPVMKRAAENAEVRCVPCAILLSAETQRQLHNRQGPYYYRWVINNLIAAYQELDALMQAGAPQPDLGDLARILPGSTPQRR